jgi:hypothetical protein
MLNRGEHRRACIVKARRGARTCTAAETLPGVMHSIRFAGAIGGAGVAGMVK